MKRPHHDRSAKPSFVIAADFVQQYANRKVELPALVRVIDRLLRTPHNREALAGVATLLLRRNEFVDIAANIVERLRRARPDYLFANLLAHLEEVRGDAHRAAALRSIATGLPGAPSAKETHIEQVARVAASSSLSSTAKIQLWLDTRPAEQRTKMVAPVLSHRQKGSRAGRVRVRGELAGVFEFAPISLGHEVLELRLEVYRRVGVRKFYGRLWRVEMYRVQSTFPQKDGAPAHHPSDQEMLMRESDLPLDLNDHSSAKAVVDEVVQQLRELLEPAAHKKRRLQRVRRRAKEA